MVEEIRRGLDRLSKVEPQFLRPISRNWLDRFKNHNPETVAVRAREAVNVTLQFVATTRDGIKRRVAVTELWT